ncbi:MAG: hypothetical protein GEU80_10135 [Dehalococcoidia bacterium]|nr:hypothetical protein [Dehalococcoidia bacterium]
MRTRVNRPALIFGVSSILLMLLVASWASGQRTAEAQAASVGSFSGRVPLAGGIALLVTSETSTPAGLITTLKAAGCDPASLSVADDGGWDSYIAGAPAFVNAPFVAEVPGETPFAVRCAAVTPVVDVEAPPPALTSGLTLPPGELTTGPARGYGDLDGDGNVDAAMSLSHQPGGSGTFVYLHVIAGTSMPAPVLLGDRVIVERVSIAADEVAVRYLERLPGQPFAAVPTVPVTKRFTLQDGTLVPANLEASCELDDIQETGAFVFVTTPFSGARVDSGFTVEGCSRTFESNVVWTLYDRQGNVLNSGFTMGGGVDGPAPFTFSVTHSVSIQQVGRLEVFEEDASGGEGFPPPLNVIPVVLSP